MTLTVPAEAAWAELRGRLGLRSTPPPHWPTAEAVAPRGGHRIRRLLEQTAIERTGMPLTDDVLEELSAAFPGLYPEDDAEPII